MRLDSPPSSSARITCTLSSSATTPWLDWLAFRDYLRAHDDVAAEYAVLKQRLAAEHGSNPDERTACRAGEAAFIQNVVDLAFREGSPGRDSN